MSNTSEYIDKILGEIESTSGCYGLSTADVVQRLLGKADLPVQGNKCTSNENLIDAENFENQVSKVNSCWQIEYYRPIYSCRKVIGRIIVLAKKVVRKAVKFLLIPIVEDQNNFNAAVTNTLNAVRNNDVVFVDHIRQLEDQVQLLRKELQNIQSEQDALKEDNRSVSSKLDEIGERFSKKDSQIYQDIDYLDFENEFRGQREKIKETQLVYVNEFKDCKKVLDLGSGRGEFLELLKENNIPAIGVERYTKFVKDSSDRGLCVEHADAIEYIKAQSNDSCDGIFAAQLVEHLNTEDIITLCKESYRILHHGGKLIVETPNPTCVSTYLNSFYLDPSHIKPVHPKTLEYFLKKVGFKKIKTVFTEQSKVPYTLPLLEVPGANLAEFNDGINLLSDTIFGSQDYAIIAEKE